MFISFPNISQNKGVKKLSVYYSDVLREYFVIASVRKSNVRRRRIVKSESSDVAEANGGCVTDFLGKRR